MKGKRIFIVLSGVAALLGGALLAILWILRDQPDYQAALLPLGLVGEEPGIRRDYALGIDAERVQLTKAYLAAHNHALAIGLPPGDDVSTITFDPQIVVVHWTAIDTLEETVDYFRPTRIQSDRGIVADSGALNVGVQFIVDRGGVIYGFYPEDVMARHVIGLNHVSIGIENVANADLGAREKSGVLPMTAAQLDANERLIRYLVGKYPRLRFVIGHLEYTYLESPEHPAHHLFQEDDANYRTEKTDPGRIFMRELRNRLKTGAGS